MLKTTYISNRVNINHEYKMPICLKITEIRKSKVAQILIIYQNTESKEKLCIYSESVKCSVFGGKIYAKYQHHH